MDDLTDTSTLEVLREIAVQLERIADHFEQTRPIPIEAEG